MTLLPDYAETLASISGPSCAAPVSLLAPDERRAPIASLSLAKRAALLACLNGGSLHRRRGVWSAPSPDVCDKPICGVTVADLGRDGMLALGMLDGKKMARLTERGTWFARTAATELGERLAQPSGPQHAERGEQWAGMATISKSKFAQEAIGEISNRRTPGDRST
jgi:hypothetical protein